MNTPIVSNIAIAIFKAINFGTLSPSVQPHEEHFVKKIQEYQNDPRHRFGIKKVEGGQLVLWWLSEVELQIACPINEGAFLFSQIGYLIGDKLNRLGDRIETDSSKDLIVTNETAQWKILLNEYDSAAEVYQYFK